MKTLSAFAAATALTFASVAGATAEEVTPLLTNKSTQAVEGATGTTLGQTAVFGGLGVGATAGIVVASALLLTVVLDDESTTTSSTGE